MNQLSEKELEQIAAKAALNKSLERERPGRVCSPPSGPGRTQQQYKNECNPNVIINRYNSTGEFLRIRSSKPMYIDCTVDQFAIMRESVARIEETFNELPAMLRKRFKHDPKELLEFLENPANRTEAEELGLVQPKASTESIPVETTSKTEPEPVPKKQKKAPETEPQKE